MKKSEEEKRLVRRENICRIRSRIDAMQRDIRERQNELVCLEQALHEIMAEERKSQARAKKKKAK